MPQPSPTSTPTGDRRPCLLAFLSGLNRLRPITSGSSEWAYKPSSVPFRVTVIPLGVRLLARSSCLPEPHANGPLAAPPEDGNVGLLFGIAPGGVCLAGPRHRGRGALLPHRFTVTASRPKTLRTAVSSLWHSPSGRPAWPLTSTLPCGARTFLPRVAYATPPATARPTPPNRPQGSRTIPIPKAAASIRGVTPKFGGTNRRSRRWPG